MKSLDYELNKRQKITLLVLVVLLLVFCYIQFVDKSMKAEMAQVKNSITEAEEERDVAQNRVMNLSAMQKSMEDLKNLDHLSFMPSYNASKEELDILNKILTQAESYNISFSKITKDGNQIRRHFTLIFSVKEYQDAMKILSQLDDSEIRCMIGTVSCSTLAAGHVSYGNALIDVTATAIFYETMEGGTPDYGLPEDE